MREYDFFPDFDKEKERLLSLTKEINEFQIDDLKQSINIAFNSSLAGGLFKSEKIKIDEDVIENIKSFAKATKIEIKDSFFDIGNAGKRFSGFSSISGYLGPSVKYEETGSSKSIKKYEMIVELNDKISRLIEWLSFLDNIRDYKFIQLAISEIGNISDEEIEVNIEFPKDVYVDAENFPKVSKNICEELNKNYARKMFMHEYDNTISDFRRMPLSTTPYIPSTSMLPLYNSSTESIDAIYDFIDYDVLEKNDKMIISFTIKNIKVGETMVFPGNIIIKNKIESIDYSIISKNSKNKHSGKLMIKK